MRGIHRWPLNSLHKWPVTRKMFPFDDVIMLSPKSHSGYSSPVRSCAPFVSLDSNYVLLCYIVCCMKYHVILHRVVTKPGGNISIYLIFTCFLLPVPAYRHRYIDICINIYHPTNWGDLAHGPPSSVGTDTSFRGLFQYQKGWLVYAQKSYIIIYNVEPFNDTTRAGRNYCQWACTWSF